MQQMRLAPWLRPRPNWGAHDAPPLPSGMGGDTRPQTPPHSTPSVSGLATGGTGEHSPYTPTRAGYVILVNPRNFGGRGSGSRKLMCVTKWHKLIYVNCVSHFFFLREAFDGLEYEARLTALRGQKKGPFLRHTVDRESDEISNEKKEIVCRHHCRTKAADYILSFR